MMAIAPVSVVMPCFRCTATVDRAVSSVVGQTFRPAQLVLVDDASGDGTLDHLYALQRELGDWVHVVALAENGGAAHARNAGWDRAAQAYVAFLDADDAWHPRKLELQYGYMATHPEVALSGHLHRVVDDQTQLAPQWILPRDTRATAVTWHSLLLRHQFVTPSVMLKRDLAQRFAPDVRYMEDYRLWLEVAGAGHPIVKLQLELAAIYKPAYGAAGLSGDLWPMERAELAVLAHLHHAGKLSTAARALLSIYSLLRYLRRRLIVWLR